MTNREWMKEYGKAYRVDILQFKWELRDLAKPGETWAQTAERIRALPDHQLAALLKAAMLGWAACYEDNIEATV